MSPERCIGFYVTDVTHGGNDIPGGARSPPEGFSAQPALPFQLILGSMFISIWETGHGNNPTLCSITSRRTGERSQEPSQFP